LTEYEFRPPVTPHLRLVGETSVPWRKGVSVTRRRLAGARRRRQRQGALLGVAIAFGLVLLAWPGHAFGGTTGTGLPTDLATGTSLASGMVYVVQAGDSVDSIARLANPLDPALARRALVRELHSSVVVPGEHVLIP
jgi:hypothetical protein